MSKLFGSFRLLSWIAIACSLAGSLLMFIAGAVKTYNAYIAAFAPHLLPASTSNLNRIDQATTYMIQAFDVFLIALVLYIFACGIYSLFIDDGNSKTRPPVLGWIHVPSISHLKHVLAEVIVIILFVQFLEAAFENNDNLSWNLLVLPISILLLAGSLKLLNLKKN
ncbi:YqhA family protein [Agaribacterium haliotis]|uniref:YqhA family protein n=1 Tax=Agaribacterium haliotis TaxID=2013869 RepID=UPI000BB54C53|nr:YqhA family protein [Agaribacterium haliotis]